MSSIQVLKSTLRRRGGIARANRFNLIFSPPSVGILNTDVAGLGVTALSGGDPSKQLLNDPRDISIMCESVSIPGRAITSIDHNNGQYSKKLANGFIDEDITATFILTNDYYIKKILDKWQQVVVSTTGETNKIGYLQDYGVDVIIQQLNDKNIPVYASKLIEAYPININTIELSNSSENEVARVSVTFAYTKAVQENILDTARSTVESVADAAETTSRLFR